MKRGNRGITDGSRAAIMVYVSIPYNNIIIMTRHDEGEKFQWCSWGFQEFD